MRGVGWILLLVGAGLIVWGVLFPTYVKSGDLVTEVENLGLIADRIIVMMMGGFALVAGVVLVAAGSLKAHAASGLPDTEPH